jgi:hypothetical protein
MMKKLLLSIILLLSVANLQAQSISYIETTKNWYYIYDQDGKKTKTLSTTIGELQGFSSTFFVVKSGSWVNIYDANGKKTKTLSESYVGKVLSVAGETFTSRLGSWIYTWNKEGKKVSTRAASQ